MPKELSIEESATGFPILFTQEEFKNNILEAMLVLASKTDWTFMTVSGGSFQESGERVWSLLSPKPYSGYTFADSGVTPDDLQMTFSDVERLSIVQTLMQLYEYGVHGVFDKSQGSMEDCDGYENQISRIFYDLHHSTFLQEWSNNGTYSNATSVGRCLYVCELANARLMLEGSDDGFFLDERKEGFISIRQMALVSGMTEASIRTLASRNRKSQRIAATDSNNQLITQNDGRNTVIDIADAKAWLKAKSRYVPIKKKRTKGSSDFTSRKFVSIGEIEDAISDRLDFLESQHGSEVMATRMADSGVVRIFQEIVPGTGIGREIVGEVQLLNTELMRRFAEALELPAELFTLRAAEAVTHEKLRAIETHLKQLQINKI